jgi:superfamily II DNA/RNA helicase
MESGVIDLSNTQQLILDEADRMLDMGFSKELNRICAGLPQERQTMLFSATLPHEVRGLVKKYTNDPQHVDVRENRATVSSVEQFILPTTSYVDKNAKLFHLLGEIEQNTEAPRVLLFCNTKRLVNETAEAMVRAGNKKVQPLHGDLSFNARQRGLGRFRTGEATVLIATDVVARGIDVKGITHVVNYDMPRDSDTYIHRIGRTARAGAKGTAVSFINSLSDEMMLRRVERQLKIKPRVMELTKKAPAQQMAAPGQQQKTFLRADGE